MAEVPNQHANPVADDAAAAAGTTTGTADHTPVITDVWSWTGRKYRIRAQVLLLANLVLFSGLCVFTHWLHTCKLFDFSWQSYYEPLRFWGPQTQNLYDFILYPISVDQTPIYGVVIGLLVASIVAVPISVSLLYRFRSSLPFCAAVLVFAHMPWMAVTLVGCCILASVRPFRLSFRYGSALLALLPVLLYLYLATRGGPGTIGSVSPERELLKTGPWLLAILAACVMLALIIYFARLVNYRPGAVAPVTAVMFATPAILFHVYVGVDELTYRILESEYGPRSHRFEPVQDATERIRAYVHEWTQPGRNLAPQRATVRALWTFDPEQASAFKQQVANRLLLELLEDRMAAYDACKDFIADHPKSRYVPAALFIQGRALDTRLDAEMVGKRAERVLYTDFPHVQSESAWAALLAQYPDSPLAVAARLRVAQLRLRRGDTAGALEALASGQTMREAAVAGTQPAAEQAFLRTTPPEASLDFEPEPYLFEAQRLRELILANRDDAKYGDEPLHLLAALDPHRPGYRQQLRRLVHDFPDSRLYPNLVVRWSNADPDRHARAAKLRACIASYAADDALPEAMYWLADLEVQVLGADDEETRSAGVARLREIVHRFDETCWANLAEQRLSIFAPPATAARSSAGAP